MGTKKGGSNLASKGKKAHKNLPTSKKYSKYSVSGDKVVRNAKFCPRCGPGIFLAEGKGAGRTYCGKCHYTEFMKRA